VEYNFAIQFSSPGLTWCWV